MRNTPRKALICRLLLGVGILLYVGAVALAYVGSKGLLGYAADPFWAIFLMLFGMPWNFAVSFGNLAGFPPVLGNIAVLITPLINLWILRKICRGRR